VGPPGRGYRVASLYDTRPPRRYEVSLRLRFATHRRVVVEPGSKAPFVHAVLGEGQHGSYHRCVARGDLEIMFQQKQRRGEESDALVGVDKGMIGVTDSATLRGGDVRRNMPRFQGDNLRRNLSLIDKLKELAAVEKCTSAQLALAWVLSRAPYVVPIPGTSHRRRLEENAAAVSLKISADTEDALLQVFAPGAASGLRYPENHLKRLGI
jgi:hypothetical protein